MKMVKVWVWVVLIGPSGVGDGQEDVQGGILWMLLDYVPIGTVHSSARVGRLTERASHSTCSTGSSAFARKVAENDT